MPRRNLRWLIAVTALSGICYAYVPGTRFSRVAADNFDRIAGQYYRPVNDFDLFEGAMSGMVTKLGDKYSKYIPPVDQQDFENDLNQEFVGIGVIQALDPKTKQVLVLSPVPDGPAVAAGVRAGDLIVKIEDQATQGLSLAAAKERIQGKAGTPVTITVQHPKAAEPVDLTIVRRKVHVDTVEGASHDAEGRWNFRLLGHPEIGYIWIREFAESEYTEKSTASDFRAALEELCKQGLHGLVLDLRGDPGGSLRAAIAVCDLLVAQGEIVTTRGRDHQVMDAYRASGKAAFTDFPIAVLVNGRSASASEIVAACLQDNGRAIVAGQRSYGKGTVQQVFELGQPFGMLKLTVATYWRPSGQDINRPPDDGKDLPWGVTPNEGFEVPVSDKEREQLLLYQQDRDVALLTGAKPPPEVSDRVLVKAVEYLEAK